MIEFSIFISDQSKLTADLMREIKKCSCGGKADHPRDVSMLTFSEGLDY